MAPQVLTLCQTIVYISCSIYDDDVLSITCKMYMNAAKESGYNLVFVDKYGMERECNEGKKKLVLVVFLARYYSIVHKYFAKDLSKTHFI